MEYITLMNSDLTVSRICMGGCPMGQYGWGAVQEEELLSAVSEAVENGINFFDTADTYGLGTSEKTLAKALGSRKNDVVIADKFGVRVENGHTFYDNSPEWIEKALAGSLQRLGRDYIDLYQIHYRDNVTPIESVVEALERLKEKGHIRYYGLSNIHEDDLGELKKYKGCFVSFQDEYSLACRKNEADIFKAQEQLNITPMTWGSLGQGILTGRIQQRQCIRERRQKKQRYLCEFSRRETGKKSSDRREYEADRCKSREDAGGCRDPLYPGLYSGFCSAVRREESRTDPR